MTSETILTDEQIIRILEENRPECDGLDKAIIVSRAIEQAVLQSLPAQTSSAIRGDSYAGVYVWRGRDNITQHIPKRLVENESNPHGLLECVAAECVRELEQSVLQSPEVQALKRDKERLDWLESSKYSHGFCHDRYGDYIYYAHQLKGSKTVREVIDDAMEKKQ